MTQHPAQSLSGVARTCSGKYPPIPSHYSDGMKALVDALIKREPSERPTLEVCSARTMLSRAMCLMLRAWRAKPQSWQAGTVQADGLSVREAEVCCAMARQNPKATCTCRSS